MTVDEAKDLFKRFSSEYSFYVYINDEMKTAKMQCLLEDSFLTALIISGYIDTENETKI